MPQIPERFKHPRTPHLPWSPGRTPADRALLGVEPFLGEWVAVTEKMDGECTTIYCDGTFHARSTSSRYHESQWAVRLLADVLAGQLPPGWRVVAENCYARHSIAYTELPAWVLLFAVFDEKNRCLSWDDTKEWAARLAAVADRAGQRLALVPELYVGPFQEDAMRACWTGRSRCGGEQEGYVIRVAGAFPYEEWAERVAKFVRPGHVQTDADWKHRRVVPNALRI